MKKNNLLVSVLSLGLLAVVFFMGPLSASAQVGSTSAVTYTGSYCSGFTASLAGDASKLSDIIKFFTCLIQVSVIPLIVSLGVAMFVWGTVKFIGAEQVEAREQGKQFMIWGIVGLSVIFCVWGLVNILGDTFHVRNVIPQLPVNAK